MSNNTIIRSKETQEEKQTQSGEVKNGNYFFRSGPVQFEGSATFPRRNLP
jgi:hypothetical protein